MKQQRSTDELYQAIDKANNIEDYINTYSDQFQDIKFSDYINTLLKNKKLKKADVIRDSQINNSYCYDIFAGTKQPTRDKLIQLCFGFHLNITEANHLLIAGGVCELYPRSVRDSIIIYSLNHNQSIYECEETLFNNNLETLLPIS